ncbi:molecular chaperone DnaK [Ktedonobacteria bacterium brp13]|nr:molecular chaperone DnaK [Ktedonobacteria bacterium brp13]
MGAFIGIDLGTTYSVVAYVNPATGQPVIIRNAANKAITPSVIAFDSQPPLVGDEAKERQLAGETEVASFFKRNMGDPHYLYTFADKDYTPTQLSTLIIQHLKQLAEQHLRQKVTHAVITVPAYFTHIQRSATIEAGEQAGLHILKIISEPTAAALAYGLRPGAAQREQRILVYDLGGGTFDISLISISEQELTVMATEGDHQLGGKDWDDRLIAYIAEQFEQEFASELIGDDINELRVQTERLKHTLSSKEKAEIRVHAAGHTGTYTVTRACFEELTRDLVERTRTLSEMALHEKQLSWSNLDGVLLVGGSTRMPMIGELIQHVSGKPPMRGINPDEAVALGAAIQATMEKEREDDTEFLLVGRKQTTDVIAHSLGMIAVSEDHSRYRNSIIIRKNLPIPSERARPYMLRLRYNNDTHLEVYLTQGENEDPQQCVYLGSYIFEQFPKIATREAILDITYRYDKNGMVEISAVERTTRQSLKVTVLPVPPDVPLRFLQHPDEQQTQREHITIYLAFDLSGSMQGDPLAAAKLAAEEFVNQCDLTTTSIGLISFSDRVSIDLIATQNADQIFQSIQYLTIGRTGIENSGHPFDAIENLLSTVTGRRYAVVLADGVWEHQKKVIRKAQKCHAQQIEVIAVGFGAADEKFLRAIASSSEQSLFTDLSRLSETFSTIAQEITEANSQHSNPPGIF